MAADGGDPMSRGGWHHTEETKARVAASLRHRPRTAEVRRKISKSKRGLKATPEHRAAISAARKRDGGIGNLWKDPAFRAAQARRSSERMTARHAARRAAK